MKFARRYLLGIRKGLKRPVSDHLLFVEALVLLTWSKMLIHGIPFRWLARYLGPEKVETPHTLTAGERELARRVEWAVEAVSRYVPGFVCFPQAVTAKWMLRRRGLASTLYMGIRHEPQNKLSAHAWLRAGDKILTGRIQSFRYLAVANFGER